ncbi:MAG: hypothetical protein HC836_19580 [Richelia sp. RM2_1_2]|nr:hypothetical protein [Richelia sp. RM1_1_1]NJO60386.1 hypothetical protein [Richelia sp. RM2_1_2]
MHYQKELFSTGLYQTSAYVPIYDPAWDNTSSGLESPKHVLERVSYDTIQAVPEQHTHWIEEYSPSNRKQHKYYRYCWKLNGRIHHKHIPGGNVHSAIAIYRMRDIQVEILIGTRPCEILAMINQFVSTNS